MRNVLPIPLSLLVACALATGCSANPGGLPPTSTTSGSGSGTATGSSAGSTSGGTPDAGPKTTLTILHTNDIHSWDLEVPGTVGGEPNQGGGARRATLIKNVRNQVGAQNVLLVDSGDFTVGTPFMNVWKGSSDVALLNAMGYDAVTLGNHEFDNGPAKLARMLSGGLLNISPLYIDGVQAEQGFKNVETERLQAAVVASNLNVEMEPTLQGLVAPYAVITKDGQQYGIVGAITETTPVISSPGPTLQFEPYIASVNSAALALTNLGVTKIILLSHTGSQLDLANASQLHNVDVIIAGHDHVLFDSVTALDAEGLTATASRTPDPYPMPETDADGNTVLVVSAYCYGRWVGRLDVTFDANGHIVPNGWVGDPMNARGCEVAADGGVGDCAQAVAEDEAVKGLLDAYQLPVEPYLQVVGQAAVNITRYNDAGVDTAMGNVVVDSWVQTGTDWINDAGVTVPLPLTALSNSGGLRADINQGSVAFGDTYSVLPFGDQLHIVQLTAAQIYAALDNGFSRAVGQSGGAFPQVSGMRVTWKDLTVGVPTGSAPPATGYTQSVVIGGQTLDPNDQTTLYSIVIPSYLAGGGDFYQTFASVCAPGGNPVDGGITNCAFTNIGALDSLVHTFETASPVTPATDVRLSNPQ